MRLYGALLLSVMLALFAYCHAVTEVREASSARAPPTP